MFQSQILEDPLQRAGRDHHQPRHRRGLHLDDRQQDPTQLHLRRVQERLLADTAREPLSSLTSWVSKVHYSELVGIIINLVTIVASIWTTVNKILHSYNYGVSKNVYILCWSGTVVIFIWHHANHTCNFQVFLSLVSVILGLSSTELRLSLTMADLVWDIVTVIGTLLVGALCAGVRSIFHIYYFIYN